MRPPLEDWQQHVVKGADGIEWRPGGIVDQLISYALRLESEVEATGASQRTWAVRADQEAARVKRCHELLGCCVAVLDPEAHPELCWNVDEELGAHGPMGECKA